jgi:hypothetical protein
LKENTYLRREHLSQAIGAVAGEIAHHCRCCRPILGLRFPAGLVADLVGDGMQSIAPKSGRRFSVKAMRKQTRRAHTSRRATASGRFPRSCYGREVARRSDALPDGGLRRSQFVS